MHIEEFKLERLQSLWENKVEINLTESGIHPYSLRELLDQAEIDALLDLRLGYGWTNGEPALREAIAQHYPRAHRENVLVTNGSAEANFLAIWTLLEPGDEIVVMLPNYMQIWGLARALGVEVKPFHLREDAAWSPDLDELAAAVTPRTKMIVVCNPNNPTGAVLSRPEMEAIVRIAEQVGATVYADEVYKGVQLEGEEGPSFHDLYDRAIVAAGLSKALAHPGLRIGWLVGPESFIADAWHRNDYTTITTALPSEYVATRILEPARRQQILDRNRRMLRENLGVLNDWLTGQRLTSKSLPDQGVERPGLQEQGLDEQDEMWTFTPPRAGGMAFLRYHHPIGSTELATRLREERNILVLPGDVYGMDHYLRLGIGERRDVLAKGLDILGAFLATL